MELLNRAELGLELAAEKLMLAQKWMIDKATTEGKPIFRNSGTRIYGQQ